MHSREENCTLNHSILWHQNNFAWCNCYRILCTFIVCNSTHHSHAVYVVISLSLHLHHRFTLAPFKLELLLELLARVKKATYGSQGNEFHVLKDKIEETLKFLTAMRGRTPRWTGLSFLSVPFFTSYRLFLHLYMDGDGSGKGNHHSFFLTVMWRV